MFRINSIIGHPGLAPLLWWIVGIGVGFQLLFAVGTLVRYLQLRPLSPQAITSMVLPLAGNVCFSTGLLFMLLMLQLMLTGQASFWWLLLSVLVAIIGSVVYAITT